MSCENLGNCQAEIHAPQFYNDAGQVIPHTATSIDHLTPRTIAKELGWRDIDYKYTAERVPMHTRCHALKDSSTKARLHLLERIKKSSVVVTLDDYRRFRNKHDLVFVDGKNGHQDIYLDDDQSVLLELELVPQR